MLKSSWDKPWVVSVAGALHHFASAPWPCGRGAAVRSVCRSIVKWYKDDNYSCSDIQQYTTILSISCLFFVCMYIYIYIPIGRQRDVWYRMNDVHIRYIRYIRYIPNQWLHSCHMFFCPFSTKTAASWRCLGSSSSRVAWCATAGSSHGAASPLEASTGPRYECVSTGNVAGQCKDPSVVDSIDDL